MTGPLWGLAGLVLLLLGVALGNALLWPRFPPTSRARPGRVSVLIPARNEEENLQACLTGVLAQGEELLEVLVYDDASTDRTAELARAAAARDARVRLLTGGPLPPGWTGKNHACFRLAAEARGAWLFFLDADARLLPGALASLLEAAERYQATFVSAWPGLVLGSFAERWLMPLLNFFVFSTYPAPLALKRREAALGLAHGAAIFVRRLEYEAFGGHERVKAEIFEDTCFARLWRREGRFGICLDGQDVVRVRMYRSFGEIWRGFQKNFYPGFRRELFFWLFLLFHFSLFLLPFLLLPLGAWFPGLVLPVLVMALAVLGIRLVLALRFRQPLLSVLLHPAGEAVLLALGLASRARARASGVVWKGRSYGGSHG